MLVLSRKIDQEIMIGDNIKITILKVRGNTVRIGIEAPRDINVKRGELVSDRRPASAPVSESKPEQPSQLDSTVTIEFKTHGSGECQPQLRVIGNDGQESTNEESADPPGGIHRLLNLVQNRNELSNQPAE